MHPVYIPKLFTNDDEPLLEMAHDSIQSDALPCLALQFYRSYNELDKLNGVFYKKMELSSRKGTMEKGTMVTEADSLTEHPPYDSGDRSSIGLVAGSNNLSDCTVVPQEHLSRAPSQTNSTMLFRPIPNDTGNPSSGDVMDGSLNLSVGKADFPASLSQSPSHSNSTTHFCPSADDIGDPNSGYAVDESLIISDCNVDSQEYSLSRSPSLSDLPMLLCPSPEGCSFAPSFASAELSECTVGNNKLSESEVANPCVITESRNPSIVSDVSDASSSSSFSSIMSKPHKARDRRWEAIRAAESRHGQLGLEHFRLLKKLGCGDIGSVYLSVLKDHGSYFAMKVMDKPSLTNRKKLARAQTEREILQSLDHPFLPTLYIHFETEKFSCLVMEFCPGGDLHTLRQKQAGKCFTERAARFYAAEVLLALEYLHMLGIIYRDLKPENVMIREDGHIMLVDFDLSRRCSVSPTLVKSSNSTSETGSSTSCARPPCFGPRFLRKPKKPKQKEESFHHENVLPELVAEPTDPRSMSFVGTHEYLAPEIIRGEGHGSAVDWWTFGVFLYELLFGRTPFKGTGNRITLLNIVGQRLEFPDSPSVSFAAKDLIRTLLVKDPKHRLGYARGAAEVKRHQFFRSINWALIRCANPPLVPKQVTDGLIEDMTTRVHGGGGGGGVVAAESTGNCSDFGVF